MTISRFSVLPTLFALLILSTLALTACDISDKNKDDDKKQTPYGKLDNKEFEFQNSDKGSTCQSDRILITSTETGLTIEEYGPCPIFFQEIVEFKCTDKKCNAIGEYEGEFTLTIEPNYLKVRKLVMPEGIWTTYFFSPL